MPRDPQPVQEIFLRLVELPPGERRAALERECGSDGELRARVEALLEAHDEADSYLDQPPSPGAYDVTGVHTPHGGGSGGTAGPGPAVGRDGAQGVVIAGRYTLEEKIGEGGMGEVWVARQTEPVRRKVALKLIKSGIDSRNVLARFEQERQALALMDHPHIARVFDGGQTPTGQPFFAMELVNGLPLTQFCDEMKLTPQDRLALFVPICQAVQHAHQKGIVHRDLKPANILVTIIDGQPVPKVIDFGVAKATTGKLLDETMSTAFGAVVGTLEYMSPEQAAFSSTDVDTRADIYSLGVILYELLTGLRPFDAKRLKQAALMEMIRIIQEEDPARPSTRLSTDEALPSLAAARQTDPGRLTALLREELDWVVMKCLEKQRDRRYETAGALARDIQRYLAGDAVEACPPSWSYQFGKFLQRHQGPAIAVSLIVFALVAGIVGTTWGLFEAKDQADKKQQALDAEKLRTTERDAANSELTHRLGVSELLLGGAAYDNGDVRLTAERLDKVPAAQRGWDWNYRQWQTRGGLFALEAFRREVTQAAFSPDGTRIVTWEAGQAKLWDARTGVSLAALGEPVSDMQLAMGGNLDGGVAFSPDGRRLVTVGAYDASELKIWDTDTGKLLFELKNDQELVNAVAFSPDGRLLATAGEVRVANIAEQYGPGGERLYVGGRLKIWDLESKEVTRRFDLPGVAVNGVAFSPDGKRIVAGCHDGGLKIWSASRPGDPAAEEKPPLLDHPGTIRDGGSVLNCISFSPDGQRLLAGYKDSMARVFSAADGAELLELQGRKLPETFILLRSREARSSAAYSPDGSRIVTAGGGNGVWEAAVWDARTGTKLLALVGHKQPVVSAAFSPDGLRIITSSEDATVRVWDARTGTPRIEWGGPDAACLAFSPDGKRLAIAGVRGAVWDLTTGLALFKLQGPCDARATAFSRDGKRLVTAGGRSGAPGQATVWDAQTGARLFALEGLTYPVNRVSFNQDGTQLVTASEHGRRGETVELKAWDGKTGTLVRDLTQANLSNYMEQRGGSVAFNREGTRLVTGDAVAVFDATVWDGQGARLFDLKGHQGPLLCVAFSPNGQRIVTGAADDLVKVWDAATGQPHPMELRGHTGWILGVAFSPDGTRIVTGGADKTVRVWDAATGTTLLEFKDLPGHVDDVAFSPDGARIAASVGPPREPNQVIVWEAPPPPPALLDVPSGNSIAFSPDGARVALGGLTVRVYEVKTRKLLLESKELPPMTSKVVFSRDGTRLVVRVGLEPNERVWDAQTGKELPGEAAPAEFPAERVSPGGELFARFEMEPGRDPRLRLVRLQPAKEEQDRRRSYTQINLWRYQAEFDAAQAAGDRFAAKFYLRRLPPDVRPRLEAQLALDGGALAEAAEWYGKAIELEPKSVELRIALGHLLRDRGDHQAATARYLQAIELDPSRAMELAGRLSNAGHHEEAIACFRKAIELDPDNGDLYQMLAALLAARGGRKEAIALLRAAPQAVQGQTDLQALLAEMLLHDGQIDEAFASFLASSERDPRQLSRLYELQAYYGREKDLTVSWQRLLALHREGGKKGLHAALACCLRTSATPADLKEAHTLAQEGMKELPVPYSLMVVGITEHRLGDHASAAEKLQRAAEKSAGGGWAWIQPIAHFYRAMALFKQGKEAEARTVARAAAAEMPPLPKDNEPPTDDATGVLLTWVAYKQAKPLINFELPPDK